MNLEGYLEYCNGTDKLVSTSTLSALIVLLVISAILAMVTCGLFVLAIWRVPTVHVSVRLLTFHLCLNMFVYSVCNAVKAICAVEESGQVTRSGPCPMMGKISTALTQSTTLSLTTLALQRIFTTVKQKISQGESIGKWPGPEIIMIAMTWVMTFTIMKKLLTEPGWDTDIACDMWMSFKSTNAPKILAGLAASEAVGLGFSTLAYLSNQWSTQRQEETTQICWTVMVLIMAHTVCYLPTYGFLIMAAADSQIWLGPKMVFLQCAKILRLIYAMIAPILIFKLNKQIRRGLIKAMPGCMQKCMPEVKATVCPTTQYAATASVVATATIIAHYVSPDKVHPETTKAHFEILQQMWSQQPQQEPVDGAPPSAQPPTPGVAWENETDNENDDDGL